MTPNAETLRIITAWVTRLADLTSHREGKPSKDAIATYAAVLGQALPSGAFNLQSLAAVTATTQWFPAVAAILPSLQAWWNENKPRSAPAITHQQPDGWTDVDGHWERYWHTRQREISQLEDPRVAEFQRGRVASLIRTHAPRAWQKISGERPSSGRTPDPAEVAAVSRLADRACAPAAAPGSAGAKRSIPAGGTLQGEALERARAAAKLGNHP